jgi:hypothetical protein
MAGRIAGAIVRLKTIPAETKKYKGFTRIDTR